MSIAFKKREGLNHDGNRSVKLRPCFAQDLPLIARVCMKRISRERKCNPRATVDKGGFALPQLRLVVNAIVVDRRPSRFAIPYPDGAGRLGFEHDGSNRFTHDFRDATA